MFSANRSRFPAWLLFTGILLATPGPLGVSADSIHRRTPAPAATALPGSPPPGERRPHRSSTIATPIPLDRPRDPAPGEPSAPPAPPFSTPDLLSPSAAPSATATRQRPLPAFGNAKAHYVLGKWLEGGALGTLRSWISARAYRCAADRGFAEAQMSLAMILQFGVGVPVDMDEAEKWFAAAAAQGNQPAAASLARLQASSLGMDSAGALSAGRAVQNWLAKDNAGRQQARQRARVSMQTALELYVRDRDLPKTRAALLACLQEDPSYVEPRLNLARLAETEEDWDGAIRWLEEAVKTNATSQTAVEARVNIERLRSTKALAQTPAGLRQIRYDTEIAATNHLLEARAFGDAIAHAENAMLIDASRFEAPSLLASAYSSLHDNAQAQRSIRQALEKAPPQHRARLQKASAEIDQDIAAGQLIDRATAALSAEQFVDAGTAYEQAWRTRPDREGYALRAALAYQLGGSVDRARVILKKLLASKDLAVTQAATNQLAKLNAASP